jgi:photosystem II stability/assembly factor-like uncharacterized protein
LPPASSAASENPSPLAADNFGGKKSFAGRADSATIAQTGEGVGGGLGGGTVAGNGDGKNFKIASNAPPRELDFARVAKMRPGAQAQQSLTLSKRAPAPESIEAAGAAASVQTENAVLGQEQSAHNPSSQSRDTTTIARNEFAEANKDETVGKAKPAQAAAPLAPMAANNILWAITPTGALQRSFDGGSTWINVNPTSSAPTAAATSSSSSPASRSVKMMPAAPTVFRAVVANGVDVWAGASAGLLYHSTDSGDHWSRVTPFASGSQLTGDIVGIQFSDTQNGKVSTSAGEVWTTSDAGHTWQK